MNKIKIDKPSLWNLPSGLLKDKIINGRPYIHSEETGYYDVALSFAGEDRVYVEKIAEELRKNGVNFFYDRLEKDVLWGKYLIEHLSELYATKSKYVLMFISNYYLQKAWPTIERKAALTRLLHNDYESILPIIMDDVELPSIFEGKGYLDSREDSVEQICHILIKKLSRIESKSDEFNTSRN